MGSSCQDDCRTHPFPVATSAPVTIKPPLISESRLLPTGLATSDDEYAAFSFFLENGAASLSAYADEDLWGRVIPQRSVAEPAVRHALLAIGALLQQKQHQHQYQQPVTPGASNPSRTTRLSFALHQYNLAIRQTLHSIQKQDRDHHQQQQTTYPGGYDNEALASLTCVLFFCIEALQGNENEALRLFERGRTASVAWQKRRYKRMQEREQQRRQEQQQQQQQQQQEQQQIQEHQQLDQGGLSLLEYETSSSSSSSSGSSSSQFNDSYNSSYPSDDRDGVRVDHDDTDDIERRQDSFSAAITNVFVRLGIQCATFDTEAAGDWSPPRIDPHAASRPIASIAQARDELTELVKLGQLVVEAGFQCKWALTAGGDVLVQQVGSEEEGESSSALGQGLRARQRVADAGLRSWHARFVEYSRAVFERNHAWDAEGPPPSPSQRTRRAQEEIDLLMLQLRCMTIRVWLGGCLERSEMIYDSMLGDFSALLAAAWRVIGLMEEQDRILQQQQQLNAGRGGVVDERAMTGASLKSLFTFELGLLPPLYITATKCRHPTLRRQALGLMRRAPAQEGLWNRDILMQVAQRAIQLEEGQLAYSRNEQGIYDSSTVTLPPDEMRMKFIKVGLRTTDGYGRKGDQVEFYTMPKGWDNGWSMSAEFFAL
ncbi:hypothetical protein BX600DRAFT_110816 [Xylariales sp. PMI_506]|nr:hypothetical protein BX600DRAFT_110816 [Xylariales sp. PMI_506]